MVHACDMQCHRLVMDLDEAEDSNPFFVNHRAPFERGMYKPGSYYEAVCETKICV